MTSAEPSSLVFFTFKRRKVALVRPATHEDAVKLAKKTFIALRGVPSERIVISANLPDHAEQGVVEIAPETWKLATIGVKEFTLGIIQDEAPAEETELSERWWQPSRPPAPGSSTLQEPGPRWEAPPPDTWQRLPNFPKARKPVIYLYPPSPISVKVQLSLASTWKLSAVYPQPVNGFFNEGESSRTAEWDVMAHPDGTMKIVGTSMEVAYIYWEADAQPSNGLPYSPPISRSPSPLSTSQLETLRSHTEFIPGTTRCSPHDSVVMSVQEVPPYLEKALLALGFHTEARTSFITYWLPDFLKHTHLALRFVPQVDYEASAPLDINPKPDVVTRVFMLFEGIPTERLEDWDEARKRSLADVNLWKDVVRVDAARHSDTSLFRVLEWGGMEVR